MERAVIDELVDRVHGFRREAGAADAVSVGAAARRLRGWLDHVLGEVAAALAVSSPVPTRAVGAVARSGEAEARRVLQRTETTDHVPSFAVALAAGEIQAGHVEVLGGGLAALPEALRPQLAAVADQLVEVARATSTDDFRRRVQAEVRRIEADGGEARLERQRRAARCRTWVERESQMFHLHAVLDPMTGLEVDAQLRAVLAARYAEAVPAGCPDDVEANQDWLRAQALVELVRGGGGALAVDLVVVADTRGAQRQGAVPVDGGLPVDVGLPVEVPASVLAHWFEAGATVTPVVLNGGVVLYAPGEQDLGRSSRLASRAQRRMLRVLHRNRCCVPGCSVRFDLVKIHHLRPWEEGGPTDLANLVPLCQAHHDRVHHDGWTLVLHPDRTVTVTTPGGAAPPPPTDRQRRQRRQEPRAGP